MASAKKHNAYRGLIIWMLVLLALAALACAGYLYTQKDLDKAVQENEAEVQQTNATRIADYNKAVSEQSQREAAAVVKVDTSWPTPAAQGWDVVDLSALPISAGTQVSVTRSEMLQGGMLVVNRWHPMPSDLTDDMMVSISRHSREDKDKKTNIPTENASVMLMSPAVDALMALYSDARNEGLEMDHIIIEEGYRNMETQTQKWAKVSEKYSSRYSGEKLEEKIRAEGVAYPGTSDYQSGMSVKIYNYKSGDKEFSNTPLHETQQGRWLYDNWRREPEKAEKVQSALTLLSSLESQGYPICAKQHMNDVGVKMTLISRSREAEAFGYVQRETLRQAEIAEDWIMSLCGLR